MRTAAVVVVVAVAVTGPALIGLAAVIGPAVVAVVDLLVHR